MNTLRVTSEIQEFKKSLQSKHIHGIALDIDETLSWTIGYWVKKMQELFGNPENLSVQELIAKYRYTQEVPYWQTPEANKWMDDHRNSNEIQELLPLIDESSHVVQKINRVLPIVAYITTRPTMVNNGTKNWLKKHQFPEADIIARPPEIHISEGSAWKARVLEYLYPQVRGIIDDNPGLVNNLSENYEGHVFLYDNESTHRTGIKISPCKTWRDVEEQVILFIARSS